MTPPPLRVVTEEVLLPAATGGVLAAANALCN